MQTPPQFSAIKIAGERAYDLAREGESVDIPEREVEIGRFDLVEMHAGRQDGVRDRMRQGHLCALARPRHGARPRLLRPHRRTAPYRGRSLHAGRFRHRRGAGGGAFRRGRAARRSDAACRSDFDAIDALLVDTGAALECLPQVAISDEAANKIRLGNPVIIRGRDAPVEAEEACATARGRLVAIGAIEAGMFKPKRVFVLAGQRAASDNRAGAEIRSRQMLSGFSCGIRTICAAASRPKRKSRIRRHVHWPLLDDIPAVGVPFPHNSKGKIRCRLLQSVNRP